MRNNKIKREKIIKSNSYSNLIIRDNNNRKSKHSQANIIAVIVVILLVLVAIIIVWQVVTNIIKKSSTDIKKQAGFFEHYVEIKFIDFNTISITRTKGPELNNPTIKLSFDGTGPQDLWEKCSDIFRDSKPDFSQTLSSVKCTIYDFLFPKRSLDAFLILDDGTTYIYPNLLKHLSRPSAALSGDVVSTLCNDGKDNEENGYGTFGDGKIDWGYSDSNDPGCDSPFDESEDDNLYEYINWDELPEFNLPEDFVLVYMAMKPKYEADADLEIEKENTLAPLSRGFTHISPSHAVNYYPNKQEIPSTLRNKPRVYIPKENRADLWTGIPIPCQSSGGGYACESNWKLKYCTQEQIDCTPLKEERGECIQCKAKPSTDDSTQPWEKIGSPWNNNLEFIYYPFWEGRLNYHKKLFNHLSPESIPTELAPNNIDIIMPDIEKRLYSSNPLRTDLAIVTIKGNPMTPSDINAKSPNDFVISYKKEMARLYYEPIKKFLIDKGYTGKISYYGQDATPIIRVSPYLPGSQDIISLYDWNKWTSDWNLVDYNAKDFTLSDEEFNNHLGPLIKDQDYISPSVYPVTPDYPKSDGGESGRGELDRNYDIVKWNYAGRYLSYQLFNLEVNEAWLKKTNNDKPIMLWQWMRYHPGVEGGKYGDLPIRSHMAHASAIFPFMDGSKGIFLWAIEYTPNNGFRKVHYQYFYGLYRLSQYKPFFEGNYKVYRPIYENDESLGHAHYEFVNYKPIWRGIINPIYPDKMLVAAHNPFAAPYETTTFEIIYKDPITVEIINFGDVDVHGLNTWLGVCDFETLECKGDEGEIKENA